jgi:hypothetical protein
VTAVLLSAGHASRLGDLAPGGCKAALPVGGGMMLDWWRDLVDDELLVVVRPEHLEVLPERPDVRYLECDGGGGPAAALAFALPWCEPNQPVTVGYADTWLPELPVGSEWCAVAAARGGRRWDVVEDGLLAYRDVELGEVALVAVGAYRFGALWRLRLALEHELSLVPSLDTEVGLADVVNTLGLPLVPAYGWRDVGDPVALASWSALS